MSLAAPGLLPVQLICRRVTVKREIYAVMGNVFLRQMISALPNILWEPAFTRMKAALTEYVIPFLKLPVPRLLLMENVKMGMSVIRGLVRPRIFSVFQALTLPPSINAGPFTISSGPIIKNILPWLLSVKYSGMIFL